MKSGNRNTGSNGRGLYFAAGEQAIVKYDIMENNLEKQKPLVYSCSGCSSAAQMANYLAIQLDRNNTAEMSCIAGVGGNVKKLVKTAQSGRKIIAIDGCPLACSKACLANHAILPDLHIELTSLGVQKKREDFDKEQALKLLPGLLEKIEANFSVAPVQ